MKKMKVVLSVCTFVFLFALGAAAQDDWTLVWSDEFEGSTVDTTKWQFDIGNGFWADEAQTTWIQGWGNEEKEYYSDRPENVSVENGLLVITARNEAYQGEAAGTTQTFNYTSGKLKTKGLFSKTYGKFEARIKLPVGKGFWPAFWLLPADERYGGWAASGEIDIMEGWGSKPDVVAGTIHYGETWPNNTYSGNDYHFSSANIADFHVYGVEWEPGEIRWYVDGKLFASQDNWYSKGSDHAAPYAYPAPFDQPFYVILNLAIGGWFDGEPDATTPFPSTMEVDYVRVYELTGRPYREAGERPIPEAQPDPDGYRAALADGNYVYNNNFDQDLPDVTGVEGVANTDYWTFLHLPDFGGNGTLAVEDLNGTNFAGIDISAGGNQTYSIQLIQLLPVVEGNWYTASFDAKAAASRTINVKLSGGESRGWTGYSESNTFNLTDTVEHYEFTFQMIKESDPEARFEFNVGTNTQKVWIGNVRLEKTVAPALDPNADKAPLESGQMIYNGTFDQGDSSRMTYWNVVTAADAEASVQVSGTTQALEIAIANGGATADAILITQKGLLVSKTGTYDVAFDARAAAARTIDVEVVSRDGATSYSGVQTIEITPDMAGKIFTFTMEQETDSGAQLVFKSGGNTADVFLDNVSMMKTGGGNDYSGTGLFLLQNGTFDTDTSSWDIWTGNDFGFGGVAEMTAENQQLNVAVTGAGNEPWSIQVMQGPIDLVQGTVYQVSFDASSTVARKIEVMADNTTYYRYFGEEVALTEATQHYSYLFKMEADDTVTFKFLAGNVDNANTIGVHDIFIDNVTLEVASEAANGDFTSGTDPWAVWYANWEMSTAPVITSENGELKVSFEQVGSASWSIQVFQEGVEFINGETYTVVFDARADEARKINLAVGKALEADPFFIPYVDLQTYDLGTSMQRYSVTFQMEQESYDNGKLVFELGNITGGNAVTPVYIDNVAVIHEGMTLPGDDTGDSGGTGEETSWKLVWSDEFSGTTISDDWQHEVNGYGGGNNELQYYTDRAENSYVQDGLLHIVTIKEDYTGPANAPYDPNNSTIGLDDGENSVTQPYSSARLRTYGSQAFKYGRIEIKAKLPDGPGILPAIWMMPRDDKYSAESDVTPSGSGEYNGWAASGEIDILEIVNDPFTIHGNLHYGGSHPNNFNTGIHYTSSTVNYTQDYHIYSLEWEPGEIRWYVDGMLWAKQDQTSLYHIEDGELVADASNYVSWGGRWGSGDTGLPYQGWFTGNCGPNDVTAPFPAPYDQEFYILLNTAVGGGWPQNPTDATVFPAEMLIDYVRVYQDEAGYTDLADNSAGANPSNCTATPEDVITQPEQPLLSLDMFPIENGNMENGTTGWSLWTGDAYGMAGTAAMSSENGQLKVSVADAGAETWHVQLMQEETMPLAQGVAYTVSFDASSSSPRSIEVVAENAGYHRYFNEIPALTETMQHYSYQFTMEANDVLTFKFLLGDVEGAASLGAHDVVIDNVKLEAVSVSQNGNFADGIAPWTLWYPEGEIAAPVATVVDEELQVAIAESGSQSWSVQVFQDNLEFINGETYTVIFKARADEARKINLALGKPLTEDPWFIPFMDMKTYDLGTEEQYYSTTFTMAADTSSAGKLVFELGNIAGGNAATTVAIDNVAVIHGGVGDVSGDDPDDGDDSGDGNPEETYEDKVVNGTFESTTAPWGMWVGDGGDEAISVENGKLKVAIANAGAFPWSVQVYQEGVKFVNGVNYVVSFEARADAARKLNLSIGKPLTEAPWFVEYLEKHTYDVGTELQTYSVTFTMNEATYENGKIVFEFGNIPDGNAATTVFIDNVVVQAYQGDVPPAIPGGGSSGGGPGGSGGPSAIPEPGTVFLFGIGLLGMLAMGRKRVNRK